MSNKKVYKIFLLVFIVGALELTPSSSYAGQDRIEKISGEECEQALAGKWTSIPLTGGNGEGLKDIYAITGNAVYYFKSIYRNGGAGCEKIIGADPSTFTIYGRDPGYTEWYWAKDKRNVYYGDKILHDADVKTFQVLDYSWGKDKNHVYYMGDQTENVDAATFQIFGNGIFSYDRNHVYQVGAYQLNSKTSGPEIIPNIDAPTLVVLQSQHLSSGDLYVKDKNAVFIDEGDWGKGLAKIEGADPVTFQVLGPCFSRHGISGSYAKDKNHAYCGDEILDSADSESFEYVGELDFEPPDGPLGIGKDRQCVWSTGVKVLDQRGQCVDPTQCTSQLIADANESNASKPVCGLPPF